MFWARKPASKGPWVVSATTTGPPPHLLIPNVLSVAVGNQSTGPTAKVNEPGCAGVKKNWGSMLLRPKSGSNSGDRADGVREPRHICDGSVPTGYQVPVRRKLERNYWLDDEDVLGFFKRAHFEVCVVLIDDAPQGRQRVLRLGTLSGVGRLRWSRPCRSPCCGRRGQLWGRNWFLLLLFGGDVVSLLWRRLCQRWCRKDEDRCEGKEEASYPAAPAVGETYRCVGWTIICQLPSIVDARAA